MNIINVILTIIGSFITIFLEIITCRKISDNCNIKISVKNLMYILLAATVVTLNIIFISNSFTRIIINFLCLYIVSLFIFKMKISINLFYTSICYIVGTIVELLLFAILLKIKITDFSTFENNLFLKSIFSYMVFLVTYLILSRKKILLLIKKLSLKMDNVIVTNVIFTILLLSLFIIDIKNSILFSSQVYLGNIFLLLIIMFFVCLSVYSNIRTKKEMEKSEILLNFLEKYEKDIDEYRMYKHESLNNMLALKSIKNKNSKEFEMTLNEMISIYDKKSIGIKNIYKLPSGLKGIFYYKLNNLDKEGYNISVNISRSITNISTLIDHNEFIVLCKSIGIVLDNAIEASSITKEKYIGIDIYKKDNYIIEITNSFCEKVDIKMINNKFFSTKGNGRGLGLYILNNMIKTTNSIIFKQTINGNLFTSTFIIKK